MTAIPASSQVGFSIGLMRAGYLGGLAAWTGFTVPSAIVLVLFAYGAGVIDGLTITKQSELLATLKGFGFPVNPHERLCAGIDEVIAYCREWDKKRKELPYDTDGIVINIAEGVKPGEKVALNVPNDVTDGAKVRPSAAR